MRFLDLFLLNPYIRKKKQKKPEIRNKRAGKQIEKISYIYSYT